jgi:dTMP kinase
MKNFSKPKLICFIGIDGSGKTTLAKSLTNELNDYGFKCTYVYGRYVPMLSKPIVRLGKRILLGNKDIVKYQAYSTAKSDAVAKHGLLSFIYLNIILFDYMLQVFFKIILPEMSGVTVISDRYVYDTVINDIPRSNNNLETIENLIEKCFQIAPKPDLVFLIDLDENVAFKRKNDTPSIDYLATRRNIYLQLGKRYEMIVLDGTRTFDELKCEIKRSVLG